MKAQNTIQSFNQKFGTLGWFFAGLGGALAVGYLLRRGAGRGQLQRFAGMGAGLVSSNEDASRKLERNWHEGRDAVEEASWESFPASDPPSF